MELFVYIDAENLNNSARECGFSGVDYNKLFSWLTTKKGATRVYLYAAQTIGNSKQVQFYDRLGKLGYITRLKDVKEYLPDDKHYEVPCADCGHRTDYTVKFHSRRKANYDSELTLDVINDGVRKKYSEIIVFSGDGDFARMYEYVWDSLKKPVTVYSALSGVPGKRTSTRVKTLRNNGTIKLEALEGITVHFARK